MGQVVTTPPTQKVSHPHGHPLVPNDNQGEQEGVIALAADTPVWGNDNLLFISSAYSGGSRVLKLTQKDGKTTADELWFHRRMRLHHGTAVRIGDYIYGSSGDFGPAFLAAVNVNTGEIAYQDRSFPKSNLLLAEGKLIILDEDGNLALATATPTELKVISKVSVMKNLDLS